MRMQSRVSERGYGAEDAMFEAHRYAGAVDALQRYTRAVAR